MRNKEKSEEKEPYFCPQDTLTINIKPARCRHRRAHKHNRQLFDDRKNRRQDNGKRNGIVRKFNTDSDQHHNAGADHLPQGYGKDIPETQRSF